MKFGKYAIIDNVVHTFEQEPDWTWTIKPPTSGDELAMSKFLTNGRIEMGMDGVRREYPATSIEVAHQELALTFGGTTIPADDDAPVAQGGEPILKIGTSTEAIKAVLRTMPNEMVMEIWDALAEAVPGWGPVRPKVKKTASEPTNS